MKRIAWVIALALMIGTLVGCDARDLWDYSDPECKTINDRLVIWTLHGQVALIEKGSIEEGDTVIIEKNFVAYSLYEDSVVLCEEKDDGAQRFWTYDIQSEELQEYASYVELNKTLPGNQLEWKLLWVRNFAIKEP